jgi:hypothetical protein
MNMSDNTDKRTATQRIEDLEKVVTTLWQAAAEQKNVLENLIKAQGDMVTVKDAVKLLNKKIEAVVQVANPETGITVSSVSNLVITMNVQDLKNQVDGYLANGHVAPAGEVALNSFIVCEESNEKGELVNPRIQFRLDSQDKEIANTLVGKKVGESVSFGENKLSAKVLEIYTILEQKSQDASTETAATTEATTEAQPEAQAASLASPQAAPAELPSETQGGFELQYHGQPESTLTTPEQSSA